VAAAARYGVGETVLRYVDDTRTVTVPGEGTEPRTIPTVIRYPVSAPGAVDVRGAQPAPGRFPLVVFAHGFAVTPGTYVALMRAWVQAGYVVAAPFFPLTNADAPGGPNESDLVNQPGDMSLVITRVLADSADGRGVLRGLVNPSRIAVAGHSDGASTALDTADDHVAPDRRVDAAIILSGADMPGMDSFPFAVGSPPVLAVQGTADTSNEPAATYRWFRLARPPKFLLTLVGAGHLWPYRTQPRLGIVERETIAFLDRYLRHLPGSRARMWAAGNVSGLARLTTHAP
jgi:fermentation-respiration switch protein FrsA (DUF1100 family)